MSAAITGEAIEAWDVFVLSHSATTNTVEPVAIPGATSVSQVRMNAKAGASVLSGEELARLKVL